MFIVHIVATVVGLSIITITLRDAFEAILLPRTVRRTHGLVRAFYRLSWTNWKRAARLIHDAARREVAIEYYGPFSLLLLFMVWAALLIIGFALIHWGISVHVETDTGPVGFGTLLYLSGATFFTLGFGDVTPLGALGRALAVAESGIGFGFLAVTMGYLPVFYQAFSQREATIVLLDERAGSPPSASELLRRCNSDHNMERLDTFLEEWERWIAQLLGSHISYPLLCFFRSQHDNQSWLGALTTLLDTCALILAGIDDVPPSQARLTFAVGCRTMNDLGVIFLREPPAHIPDRLPSRDLTTLRAQLAENGLHLDDGPEAHERLIKLRSRYEPFAVGLAEYLGLELPPWLSHTDEQDWRDIGTQTDHEIKQI